MFSNAGVIRAIHGILELDMEAFDNTMAINVHGVAVTMKYAARAMVAKQIRGSIICTACVAACIGGSGPHAYTTSKHAVVGLVRSVCSELGEYGIGVNSISPFGVATPLACSLEDIDFCTTVLLKKYGEGSLEKFHKRLGLAKVQSRKHHKIEDHALDIALRVQEAESKERKSEDATTVDLEKIRSDEKVVDREGLKIKQEVLNFVLGNDDISLRIQEKVANIAAQETQDTLEKMQQNVEQYFTV
ncbi:hypothetical protein IFM89_005877 [Coptis chinensis]|uniref:Uncharacterized protein n=1 Tax=Coptis chinensis TaxID=261450 RepID=A0A835HJV2_9MAGN|nr:hypothetical protein IFM89_005877 [Coptis chinensis]